MITQTLLPFKIEMTKEKLTAHSGLVLMGEYNRGLGLRELANKYLPVPGSNRGFKASKYVESVILMLEGGGQNLEDIRELGTESGLLKLIGIEEIATGDALGDWLRRAGNPATGAAGLIGLDEVRIEINRRQLKRVSQKDWTLDADAMGIIGEKESAKWTYKGYKGYMPCLGYLFETGLCIYDEFREGNVAPGFGQLNFYEECKKRMPDGMWIARFRGDAAYWQAGLINALEEDLVKWTITAHQDSAVQRAIAGISEADWSEPIAGSCYELAEVEYQMAETPKKFRLVIRRKKEKQLELFKEIEYEYRVIATNWTKEEKTNLEVIDWHAERGQAENYNKEIKCFGLDRMPCGQSYANAVWFRLGVIAYNLFIGFKRLTCPECWWKHTIATFRWKVIQIAGRIVHHSREIVLKIAADVQKLILFNYIRQKSLEISISLSG